MSDVSVSLTTQRVTVENTGSDVVVVVPDPTVTVVELGTSSVVTTTTSGITDATTTGRAVLTAVDAVAARTAIGAENIRPLEYATLAAAVADGANLSSGQIVTVGGGQGGTFVVDSSGDYIDGITCYAFDADVSAEQTATFAKSSIPNSETASYALSHADIVFGSVKVYYDTTRPTLYFTDLELNGHTLNPINSTGVYPYIDHAAGVLRDRSGYFKGAIVQSNVTIKYKYATSTRRLRRVYDGVELNLDWTGATGFEWGDTPGPDCRNEICWAMNAIKRLSLTHLYLPRWYSFWGTIEIPSRVRVHGDGPEVSGLWLLDGYAVRHLKTDFDATTPRNRMAAVYTVVMPESNSVAMGLSELCFDLNFQGNQEWVTNPELYDANAAQDELRNTPSNNCIAWTNHGGRVVNTSFVATFYNVEFRNASGSNALTAPNTKLIATGLMKLGACFRNHSFYAYSEISIELLVGSGHAWGGYFDLQQGWVGRLEFRDGSVNAVYPLSLPLSIRDPAGVGVVPSSLHIASFDLDLTNTAVSRVIGGVGDNLRLENGRVKMDAGLGDGCLFFGPNHNGFQGQRFVGLVLRNITIEQPSGTWTGIASRAQAALHEWPFHDAVIENVVVKPADEVTNSDATQIFQIKGAYQDTTWSDPLRVYIRNVVDRTRRVYGFATDITSESPGLSVFVQGAKLFTHTYGGLLRVVGNGATVSNLTHPASVTRLKWLFEDCEFWVQSGSNAQYHELLLAVGRFQNVRAMNLPAATATQTGNTGMDGEPKRSECNGVLTFTASGGETTKLIALPLWWAPTVYDVRPGNAAAATAGIGLVESTNAAGTAWAGTYDQTDRTSPYLKVTFTNALSAGSMVLRYSARIRQEGDPSPIA